MPVPISELFVTVGADVTGLTSGLQGASAQLTKFGSSVKTAGSNLTQALTVPIVGAGAAVVLAGAGMEHAFTGVRKTVDGLGDTELKAFQQDLVNLSKTNAAGGKSAEDLAHIAEIAGTLGIEGRGNLLSFTKTIAGLSVATGIAEEQIAADFAVLTKVMDVPEKEWENMASAITGLGNKMGGTEEQLIEITNRLSGALHSVGVSAQDTLGIASGMAELGINPEEGGTAVSKFFLEMERAAAGASGGTEKQAHAIRELQDKIQDLNGQLATATTQQQQFGRNTPAATVQKSADQVERLKRELGQAGTDLTKLQATAGGGGLAGFAKVAGVTEEEFRAMLKRSPSEAFQAILKGLHGISDAKGPEGVVNALNDLNIDDARMTSVFLRLATGEESIAKGVKVANDEWEKNTALQNEVAAQMADTENQFKLLQNQLKAIAIEAWPAFQAAAAEAMAVIRSEVIPRLNDLKNAWNNLSPDMQRMVLIFLAIAASIGPVVFILGLILTGLGALLSPVGLVVLAVTALGAAWATNFGDIQGKTQAFVDFIKGHWRDLITLIPGLGPTILGIVDNFDAIKAGVGRAASAIATNFIFLVTTGERALRELGAFFDKYLLPPIQAVGQWIAEHILTPLIALLKFLQTLIANTGLGAALGGLDIEGAIRSAETAVASTSKGIAAGGPGTANNVVVNINNPTVADMTVGEQFATQVQNALIDALIGSEKTVQLPAPSLVPGQPF